MNPKQIYLHDWSGHELPDIAHDFEIDESELDGIEILLASYIDEDYEGYAFVLFRKDGKLYEVNGSHCSCYGLEGQWEPEETSIEALMIRTNAGGSFEDRFKDELLLVIKELSKQST